MRSNIFILIITCLALCIILFSCQEKEPSDFTIEWTCVTESAPWAPRVGHTSVVLNNKIWIIGGYYNGVKSDVWYSNDGMKWFCATESADWIGKCYHSSVAFENKLWVLAGYFSRTPSSDAWFSINGVNWYCANDSVEYGRRANHNSLVFKNKIWLIGGNFIDDIRDVWYSTNGINWVCTADSIGWSPRYGQTSVVFNDKIWLLGGSISSGVIHIYRNDIWNSADGINWICVNDSAEWSGREDHSTLVFDNKMWILGGRIKGKIYSSDVVNDVWYSLDGINWSCVTDSAPWYKRASFTSVVFDNKIWILGGTGGVKDVWYGEIVHVKR